MVVVWVVDVDLISVVGIGIGSDFSVEIGIYLFYRVAVENYLFLYLNRNELGFCLG